MSLDIPFYRTSEWRNFTGLNLRIGEYRSTVPAGTANVGTSPPPKMPIPGMGGLVYAKGPRRNIFGMLENDPLANEGSERIQQKLSNPFAICPAGGKALAGDQFDQVLAGSQGPDLLDAFDIHDVGAVDADKTGRVE